MADIEAFGDRTVNEFVNKSVGRGLFGSIPMVSISPKRLASSPHPTIPGQLNAGPESFE